MYCTPTQKQKARKQHRCTYCGQIINIGEEYARWASYEDGTSAQNKMHPECLESLQAEAENGVFEYTPYSGERPNILQKGAE